ncbi:phosphonate ABC transporter ATP-binding protein [uncultured Parvibaculum sp.]|jgi:phosphonate transport system ATP-binding protein|uniref:phosphonate ABC transporter ATP-binding protein n=1 Tax=Parvibaculum sp. TaxID=2024848 RepID=UPI000C464AF5|nr:phosphonate ABC transporter ATP-binding protein [Parvibaculum sp.]|tara:strand:- start:2089 stop:2895 length:807 start_codon:yes stop_codon:yes gene_type:complete
MLDLDNVTVRYANRVTALEKASAGFGKGQFVVLLGPSGAGKSTLLRCLNGLVRPSSGSVRSEMGNILSGSAALRAHRQRTGMIFQQHHLIGRLTALQNVLMGRLSFHNTFRSLLPLPRADRIIGLEALDRVGLADRALQRADQLSGGQQQRVGIARALAQQPHIILADEPVASLDPATADKVLALLHRICREDGITAIVSLHQVDLARRYGDAIYGLAGGRIVFDGQACALDDVMLDTIYGTASTPSAQPGPIQPEQTPARLKMAKIA